MDWSQTGVERTTELFNSTTLTLSTVDTGLLDVRQFQSYYLSVASVIQIAVPTRYNLVQVELIWYSDANGSFILSAETYGIFTSTQALVTGFPTIGGQLAGQDQMRGPFVRIVVSYLGVDTASAALRFVGTTRLVSAPAFKEISVNDFKPHTTENLVVPPQLGPWVIPVGGTRSIAGLMRVSAARYRVACDDPADAFTLQVVDPQSGAFGVNDVIESQKAAAGGLIMGDMFLPQFPQVFQVTNGGPNLATFFISAMSERVRQT